ncbi:MAG: hypothetical protein WD673_03570 [Alphaproteobacteria bacterium]
MTNDIEPYDVRSSWRDVWSAWLVYVLLFALLFVVSQLAHGATGQGT